MRQRLVWGWFGVVLGLSSACMAAPVRFVGSEPGQGNVDYSLTFPRLTTFAGEWSIDAVTDGAEMTINSLSFEYDGPAMVGDFRGFESLVIDVQAYEETYALQSSGGSGNLYLPVGDVLGSLLVSGAWVDFGKREEFQLTYDDAEIDVWFDFSDFDEYLTVVPNFEFSIPENDQPDFGDASLRMVRAWQPGIGQVGDELLAVGVSVPEPTTTAIGCVALTLLALYRRFA